jgi:NitT/TauT family transport system permease protein
MSQSQIIADAMNQERPVLPTPHQVGAELWATTMGEPILRERRGEYRPNPRSLFFHAWQTLAPTLLGFVIGGLAGILLAVGIVHNRAMDLSVMPWAIASQTIPILAIAPMIIVVLNSIGLEGLIPKSLISAYLSFFPVVVGMVKGLRSPGAMDLDLLRTYSASGSETFWKLRLPASVPFLFASLKVGIAAALVGTIVAELPTGARFGLGARLLTGSYYGQTIQIWSALFMAAICAAALGGDAGPDRADDAAAYGARPMRGRFSFQKNVWEICRFPVRRGGAHEVAALPLDNDCGRRRPSCAGLPDRPQARCDPCRLVRRLGLNAFVANQGRGAGVRFFVPILFGATLLGLWEMAVRLYEISPDHPAAALDDRRDLCPEHVHPLGRFPADDPEGRACRAMSSAAARPS